LQRISANIFNGYIVSDETFHRSAAFTAELRAHAPALAELHVLAILFRLDGVLSTSVRWKELLAFVVNARRTRAGPATITVVVRVARELGVDLARASALAEQEAQKVRDFETLVDLQGSPLVMLCARTVEPGRTVERLLV
jgi:hypothetical protein